MKPDKKMIESKTFWLGIITAVLPAFPSISEWVSSNTEIVLGAIGLAIVGFRRITSGGAKFLK